MLIVMEEDDQVSDISKGCHLNYICFVFICHLDEYFVVMAEKTACNVVSISLYITKGNFSFIYLGCSVYFSYVTHLSYVLTSKISIHNLFEESQAKHMQFFR